MNKSLLTLMALLLALALPGTGKAQDALDMSYFAKIPIQHEGRIKSLKSFAQDLTSQLEIRNQTALPFLAEALFNPADITMQPLINIRDHQLKEVVGLDKNQNMFSLAEIIPALQAKRPVLSKILSQPEQQWSALETRLIKFYDRAQAFKSTATSLHLLLPLRIPPPEEVQKELGLEDGENMSYLELKRYEEQLKTYLQNLSKEETSEATRAFLVQMAIIEQNTDTQNLFRIMPPEQTVNSSEEWNSPWVLLNRGLSGPKNAEYLDLWKEMAEAYRSKNIKKWIKTTEQAFESFQSFNGNEDLIQKLNLEVSYLTLNPYFYSLIFYSLGLFLCMILSYKPELPLHILPAFVLIAGMVFHATALGMRMMILERPPVSTLYESVVFVSFICMAAALLTALFCKEKLLPLFMGALSGVLFYFLASYLAKEGDTLQVLTAVLDTNFWLATHVIIITAGYGCCIITALLAHYYLYMKWLDGTLKADLPGITLKLALVSLLFTSVGTILGGIWADQSWGRFWGWDPKENGALLIVLWLIWAIHGKIAGQLKELGFMICMAYLNIIVALAWFGVNLLSVGLHSYGFISGIAYGLSAFCMIELLLIATPSFIIYRRRANEA